MADAKRSSSQIVSDAFEHEDKRANTVKPGRKPVDTEPKSRRTAQNRAAQRAYRERKERKMKDLEDKVASLEDDKMKALSEKDVLKAQIGFLKRELRRVTSKSSFPLSEETTETSSQLSRERSLPSFGLPNSAILWPCSSTSASSDVILQSHQNKQQIPDLFNTSSPSTSPMDDSNNVTPNSSSFNVSSGPYSTATPNMTANLDKDLNPFCAKLSEACGDATKPEPKVRRWEYPVPPYVETEDPIFALPKVESPFHSLFSPNENLSDPFFSEQKAASFLDFPPTVDTPQNDPLAFLNNAGFDVTLAFGNSINNEVEKSGDDADSKLSNLVTEDSLFDSLTQSNSDFDFNTYVKDEYSSAGTSRTNSEVGGRRAASSMSSFDNSPTIFEDTSEVVPAGQKTMDCSEIWDRITSHPRYTEIDIDHLCMELQTKAKCSDKGVVVNVSDVKRIVENSAMKKKV